MNSSFFPKGNNVKSFLYISASNFGAYKHKGMSEFFLKVTRVLAESNEMEFQSSLILTGWVHFCRSPIFSVP